MQVALHRIVLSTILSAVGFCLSTATCAAQSLNPKAPAPLAAGANHGTVDTMVMR